MTHANAPLTVQGRRRLVARCEYRPIAHVAAEMGISMACAGKWVNRHRGYGDLGLQDRSSTPRHHDRYICRGGHPHRDAAERTQMVCQLDRFRTCRHNQSPHRHPPPAPPRTESAQVHRSEWRTQPRAAADLRAPTRTHGARRHQEGRTNPRRWRLASTRQRISAGEGSRESQDCRRARWIRLIALRDRWILAPRLYRGAH